MTARVLLLASTRSYRVDDFVAAAHHLGIEVRLGNDRCHQLAEIWSQAEGLSWPLDFRDCEQAALQIEERAQTEPICAIVPTDDYTSVIASLASRRLGLRANPPNAALAAENKALLRMKLHDAGVFTPKGRCYDIEIDPANITTAFPVVVKPLVLSASRGVMRANDARELRTAFMRLRTLLMRPEIAVKGEAAREIMVEEFVPGPEVALEGLLSDGVLQPLALFDKPDPLDGPFFAETIYVTPAQWPTSAIDAILATTQAAVDAMGLREGPIHAELRLPETGPCVLEVAARAIGGLCSRVLTFGVGVSLEEVILSHAVGKPITPTRGQAAGGVLMLPIPRRGILKSVGGLDEARSVCHVTGIEITAPLGQELVPLPEGASYLGFAFAEANTNDEVIAALRKVQELVRVDYFAGAGL